MEITRRNMSRAVIAAAGSLWSTSAVAAANARPKPDPDVIVIGAGVSGLQTAWLLEQQGARVTMLEARRRVGGRVFTLFDQPGTPEMGFNSMGAGYARAMDAARRSGVVLYDTAPRMVKAFHQELVLGGQVIGRAQWAQSPANPFPASLKPLMPWDVTPALVARHNPLSQWADWTAPENAKFDVSMHDFLAQQGLSEAAIKLAFDTAPYYGTSARDVSALLFDFSFGWAKMQASFGPKMWAIEGGNQKLPEAMARLLKGDVLLGKVVVAITQTATGVAVHCQDGAVLRAKHVVCSLPFSTARKLTFEPALTGAQARAVQDLPYQPISIAFLTVASPFWQKDGLAPSMWSDGTLGGVVAQYFGPSPDDVSGFSVYARGNLAKTWDSMGQVAVLDMIVRQIEAIRPAARGQLRGAYLQSWTADPFNAGDWAYFKPGQITDFVRVMSNQAGRVHFCGEHTATYNRGVEGAFESAERVAIEVLSA
jgi:monoamine oxidase